MMKIKLLTHVPQDRNNLRKNNPKTVFKGYLGSKESIQLCSAVIKLSERFPGIPERFPSFSESFPGIQQRFPSIHERFPDIPERFPGSFIHVFIV